MQVSSPVPMKDLGDYISREDAERLLDSARGNTKHFLILALLWRCGLRASEAAGLIKKNILTHEERGVLSIIGKGNKPGRVPVEQELFDTLVRYIRFKEEDDFVFPSASSTGHITRIGVYKIVKRYSIKSGVLSTESGKRLHPHSLRHSIAIYMVQQGIPIEKVRQLLRHSSLAATTHYLQFSMKDLAGDYFEMWEGKPI